MNDQERTLRNLDKLSYMQDYLNEDHANTKASLDKAANIREESKLEMDDFNMQSKKELAELEDEVNGLQHMISEAEKQHSAMKEGNE